MNYRHAFHAGGFVDVVKHLILTRIVATLRRGAEGQCHPRILRAELTIRAPSAPPRLFGTGMIVVNPPFVLEAELRLLLPSLATILSDHGHGGHRLDWIRGE